MTAPTCIYATTLCASTDAAHPTQCPNHKLWSAGIRVSAHKSGHKLHCTPVLARTRTCTHMSLRTHVHMHTHVTAHTRAHAHTCHCTHMCTCTHTHTRAHAHTHTHTRAHAHTHITLCCFNFFPRKSPMLPTSLSTAKKQRTHTPTCALHSNAPLFLPDPKCALFSCHTPTCALHSNAPLFLLDPEPPRCLPQPAPTAARAARIPPP